MPFNNNPEKEPIHWIQRKITDKEVKKGRMNEKLTRTKKQNNDNMLKNEDKITHTRAKRNIIACCIQFVRHNIFVIDSAQFFLDHRFSFSFICFVSRFLSLFFTRYHYIPFYHRQNNWMIVQNTYAYAYTKLATIFFTVKVIVQNTINWTEYFIIYSTLD